LIHDDSPRIKWKLAVIEDLITGNDGLIRAANLRTSTGQTNRPIAKLYPLEVRTDIMSKTEHKSEGVAPQRPEIRSKRTAANNALKKISEWTNMLNTSPPEDVMDSYIK
jgi:hypothetical protein